MLMLSRSAVLTLTVTWLVACGGQSEVTGDDPSAGEGGTGASGGTNSTGGTSRGGTSAKGGTGGSGAVGGSTGGSGAVGGSIGGTGAMGGSTGGTGAVDPVGGSAGVGASGGFGGSMICCAAAPSCGPNEYEISGPSACPPGAMCHAVNVCCSTIWCATEVAECDAYPACDAGDLRLDTPCPPDSRCYSRSLCGSTVWCLDECNPETEYNRDYASEDPEQCRLPGFLCQAGTTYFENECGCGCEQDPTCPEVFACGPSPLPPENGRNADGAAPLPPLEPPLCDPAELARCPLTEVLVPPSQP